MSPGMVGNAAIATYEGTEATIGSDSSRAVLAAMDMGAVRAPADGGPRDGLNLQLQAVGKIHAQKVRTLMRSIAELKKKLVIATAQGKDHRRSAMIRAMRTRLREQELVVDVVKEELGRKAGMGEEETNDWVIRKTVGGPLRFRPKTREELQNELYQLEKKHRQALNRLKRQDRDEVQRGGGGEEGREQSTRELMRLSEALEEADALRVSVRSRDAALQAQAEALDQLQVENRDLRGLQERLDRKERRAREFKKKNAALGEQHTKLLEDYEAGQEQIHHLTAQLTLRTEEAQAEASGFRQQAQRQAEEVSIVLKREEDLAAALEAEVQRREREQREHYHAAREALSRRESAEKSLRDATKQGQRLRDQNEGMVSELQRLGKEAAEAAGLRERGRELAREVKRLTLEADARQGRLEEARERGARAEEALRASQESLEVERSTKESLAHEASQARELIDEGKAMLAAERGKLAEEMEARVRLEALLAAEKKKEEDMRSKKGHKEEEEEVEEEEEEAPPTSLREALLAAPPTPPKGGKIWRSPAP
eukprot:jgi/Undpi1/4424/HiC_scaffold_17.g07779.m1